MRKTVIEEKRISYIASYTQWLYRPMYALWQICSGLYEPMLDFQDKVSNDRLATLSLDTILDNTSYSYYL